MLRRVNFLQYADKLGSPLIVASLYCILSPLEHCVLFSPYVLTLTHPTFLELLRKERHCHNMLQPPILLHLVY